MGLEPTTLPSPKTYKGKKVPIMLELIGVRNQYKSFY